MTEDQPSPCPDEINESIAQDGVMFTTNISDEARIHTLINVGSVGHLSLPDAPPVTSVHQLPPDITEFTGRADALSTIFGDFAAGEQARTFPSMVAISGMAGVGKSALAIHVAHQLKSRFPDGQLYQRMGGADGKQKSPFDALGEFLRGLGITDARVPATQDERASMFRSMVDSRRYLIVLDDVQDEEHVIPLLPGSPACGVLITSRQRLTALDGVNLYNLMEMRDEEALALLQRFCGSERVQAENAAAREIAALCGFLPLAVRIVGGRLRGRPGVKLADEAGTLRDERSRLERLNLGQLSVRSALALTYNYLDEEQKRLFRVLGMVTWPDFPAPVPAHALGLDFDDTTEMLERFVDLQLLDGFGSRPMRRYRFHELVRLFARECRDREVSQPERQAQRRRIVTAIATNASILYQHMTPWTHKARVEQLAKEQGRSFDDMQWEVLTTTLTWFDREKDMLHVVARWAFEEQDWRATVSLADDLMLYASMRSHSEDSALEETQLLALKATQELGERKLEALIRNHLHTIYRRQGRYDESLAMAEGAVAIWKSEGNPIAGGQMTDNIAILVRQMGHPDLAAEGHRRAIALFEREITQAGNESIGHLLIVSTQNLGICYALQGERSESIKMFRKCLQLCRRHRDRYREAEALQFLGKMHIERGDAMCGRAIILLNSSLSIARELQDATFEGATLYFLATAYRVKGDAQQAATLYREALVKVGPDSPMFAAINAALVHLVT